MLKFESILRMTQKGLKDALVRELKQMQYKPISRDGFIYCPGTVPIMLVAHLDTVHKTPVKNICYSDNGNIIMSPEGIGGDDRAGVYMVLQIAKKVNCHILFCEDEEIGGIGAHKFVKTKIKPKLDYIIECDRRGNNDAVFYDCDNRDFTKFITSFGFKESIGSFSDISIIAPVLGAAAVNISAGYYNEHTKHEYIDMSAVNNNIQRITKIVTSKKSRSFDYIEMQYKWDFDNNYFAEKLLMAVPDGAYVKTPEGELFDGSMFFIDEWGNVYEMMRDYGIEIFAEFMEGYVAFNSTGGFLKYNSKSKNLIKIEVHEGHESWSGLY